MLQILMLTVCRNNGCKIVENVFNALGDVQYERT